MSTVGTVPPVKLTDEEKTEFLVKMMYSTNKEESLGPFLVGIILCILFCGIMCVQAVRYIGHSKEDRLLIRFFVYSGVGVGLGYSIYTVYYAMKIFVYGFGFYAQFADLKSLVPFIILEGIISVLVQSFYAQRAYRLLGNSKIFAGCFFFLAFGEWACNISLVVFAMRFMKGLFDAFIAYSYLYAWLSMQVVVDVFITVCMSWGLMRSKTGWSQTDKLISKLIFFTFETQLPSLLIALLFIIVFASNNTKTYYIAINFAMPLPYLIGMLAVLNQRDALRRTMDTEISGAKNSFALHSTRMQQATVQITTETYSQSHTIPYKLGVNREAAGLEQDDWKDSQLTRLESGKTETPDTVNNSRTRLTEV